MTTRLTPDLAVIGAGSGGLSVAAGAAQLGLDVVLFEAGEMGGDCLNSGCVPSKALLAAAKHAAAMRKADAFGLNAVEPAVDWPAVKAHIRAVIDTIAPIDSQERFEGLGCTVIRQFARFADRRTLVSAGYEVRPRRIVVATGSRPFIPPIPGLDTVEYLTNETIFEVDPFPEHLIVLGGGPIGVELGQAFRRLGATVTLVEAQSVLGRADRDHAGVVLEALRAEGVEVLEGWKAVSAAGAPGQAVLTVEGPDGASRRIEGSHLLVAVGRKPALDGLDLAAGGVAHGRQGIETKPNLRSTSNGRVWAVGDVAGRGQFTHLAGQHASVFVRNALFKTPFRADAKPVPAVTYCSPELAQIGLTEAEAKAAHGDAVTVTHWDFAENDRAQAERTTTGGGKLIVGKGGRLLGASLVGEGAGEAIQLIGLAMSNGLKVQALTGFISPYPTRGEIAKRLAGAYYTPTLFSDRTRRLVGLLQRIP